MNKPFACKASHGRFPLGLRELLHSVLHFDAFSPIVAADQVPAMRQGKGRIARRAGHPPSPGIYPAGYSISD
jgi:hypothetical protein